MTEKEKEKKTLLNYKLGVSSMYDKDFLDFEKPFRNPN